MAERPKAPTLTSSSTLPLVIFTLDGLSWAMPLAKVLRVTPVVQMALIPQGPAVAVGVINFHGDVIPVLDLRGRFKLPPRTYDLHARLLIAQTASRRVALPVDAVLGVQALPVEAIRPPAEVLPGLDHVAGVVALTDGVLLIQDLDAFLSIEEDRLLSHALQTGDA